MTFGVFKGFVWAAIESYMVKKGVKTLTMRRSFTGIASVMETALTIAYGLAPNPMIATMFYGGIDAFFTMHTGGAWANYLEVGAEDTATLNATINSVGSSLAIVVPYLGFWLRRVTGSWTAQILLSSVIKLLSGFIFVSWSSTTSARDLLAAEDKAKKAETPK